MIDQIKILICGLMVLSFGFLYGQSKTLYGKIQNKEEVEGIHVLNVQSHKNTITNSEGIFYLEVSQGDTLVVSSIKYIPEQVVVTEVMYESAALFLTLKPLVMELEEVLLFPRLSGNLERDIKSIPIVDTLNFDDVGIPGFKGKPQEKIPNLLGQVIAPTAVDMEGLYKYLSGYYKKLKLKRKWEAQNQVAAAVMHHYTETVFKEAYGVPEDRLYDYVLYCLETTDLQNAFLSEQHGRVHEIFSETSKTYVARLEELKQE